MRHAGLAAQVRLRRHLGLSEEAQEEGRQPEDPGVAWLGDLSTASKPCEP